MLNSSMLDKGIVCFFVNGIVFELGMPYLLKEHLYRYSVKTFFDIFEKNMPYNIFFTFVPHLF